MIKGSLRCEVCGRHINCTERDLIIYAKLDWPECCGQVMRLFAKDADTGEWKPIGGDTPADQ